MQEKTYGEELRVGMPVNPMDADAMEFLFNIGRNTRDYTIREIEGATYVNTSNLTMIPKYERPEADVFETKTLSGLVDWLKADVEATFETWGTIFVSVNGVCSAKVLSPLHGEKNVRDTLANCVVEMPSITLNKYLSQEDFIVMLQTHFCEGPNRDAVAAVAGRIRMNEDAQTADDGVSQRVTVSAGAATLSETIVKNPVMLAPRRTFSEVEQPASPFVLRIKKGEGAEPLVALYEADGGAWRIAAIRTIGEYLKAELAGLDVVVIA